ncbi:MAG: hypothetical protein ABIS14_01800 [Sphingomonas sp.]
MRDADRVRFDVDDARLGMSFAEVEKVWREKHPGYLLEKKSEWVEGLGSYVVSVRYADASGADTLAATFSSPASGNRAYFLSHTLQDMAVGKPIDRKAATAVVLRKFGGKILIQTPNIFGGEIVGPDGKLRNGCNDFRFPDAGDLKSADQKYEKCGLTALASITGDNESTADAVLLQITDFGLLARLAKDEANGLRRNREAVGKSHLKTSVKPTSL